MLIVQPDDGLAPVARFVESAQVSLLIKQFSFTEKALIGALLARHDAGVDVRVMLKPKRHSGDRANDATYDVFRSAGVPVQWTNPEFHVTHEKSVQAARPRASGCDANPS
jgi:phosphatidylserine/phosphatidylglycerophosphate/cardiolipin synthase-like enzyme